MSRLPFLDNKFDLVTAVETQYYWPNLVGDMREILHALKPGGQLIVIAEMYKGGKYDKLEIFEEQDKGWICGIARKPLIAP